MDNNLLVVSSLNGEASVRIYTLDGKLVRKIRNTDNGTCRIDLSMLPKGIYLVKTDTITYKIIKR